MSASYWYSSQRNSWQLKPREIAEKRARIAALDRQLAQKGVPILKGDTNTRIFLHQQIQKLGMRLAMRQIILATAEVYLSRFLLQASPNEVNVYVLVAAVLYLAAKVEEAPVHIRTLLLEARNCWPEFMPADFTRLAEMEFYLMEALDCNVAVHHPYRSLTQLAGPCGLMDLNNVWAVINDSYVTDAMLIYPPHIIALAAICISVTTSETKAGDMALFMAQSNIQIEQVAEVCELLIALHTQWPKYNEVTVKNNVKKSLLKLNQIFANISAEQMSR